MYSDPAAEPFRRPEGELAAVSQILRLEDIRRADEPLVGGKATGLARLLRHGFPVPPGFVLTRRAYEASLRPGGERPSFLIDDRLREEISTALADLGAARVIARSSASDEDSAERSFAGVYDSYADIRDLETLLRRITACWSGLWSGRAAGYRGGAPPPGSFMGVLVQEQAEARFAGVAFSRDPTTPTSEHVVVEMVAGAGESLVSGEADALRWRMGRDEARTGAGAATPENPEAARGPGPPAELAAEVATLALRIEEAMGSPQDVEWVLAPSGLVVVQSRPIPTLATREPAADVPPGFERRLDDPFTVFGIWLESRKADLYAREFRRIKGPGSRREVRFLGGRLHVRARTGRLNRLWEPLAGLAFVLRSRSLLRRHALASERYHRDVARERLVLSGLREPRDLLAALRRVADLYLVYAGRDSILAGHLANLYPALLRRVCRRLDPASGGLAEALLVGRTAIVQERDLRLRSLARLPAGEEAAGALARFESEFGYLWADLNPKDPGWRVDEQRRALLLAHHREAGEESAPERRQAEREERAAGAEVHFRERLARRTWPLRLPLRLLFDHLLRRARQVHPLREDRNHDFYTGILALRDGLLRLGASLQERGLLRDARHASALGLDEMERLIDGESSLAATAASRFPGMRRVPDSPGPAPGDLEDGSVLRGAAASPGVVRGPVRLVSRSDEASALQKGEILVCPVLRPYLTPMLLVAAGLVTDRGSILSHGANLAREYGLPAVVSTGDASLRLRTGDEIEVDGDRGLVRRVGGP